ncbi:MAG TPA: WhiB family transcriptional regulator [Mycobacteriales bacterium]|nr:WhiB family transcriptional regulator [Mycobacteriales bacterium]
MSPTAIQRATNPPVRVARLSTATSIRGRLFQTHEPVPCAADPDKFFDPRTQRRAVDRCGACPFRGRCGYNAVVTGATHGIWGGVIFPGDYPGKLAPIYARLLEQFNQRCRAELGSDRTPRRLTPITKRSRRRGVS